jgi:hypothetical protein
MHDDNVAEVQAYLEQHLGIQVTVEESGSSFDADEKLFRTYGLEPMDRGLHVPRKTLDHAEPGQLVALLQREKVGETMKSGEHWKARIENGRIRWLCARHSH